ncbi:substance-P receptor-like [Stylophora pistillata]|uniref:substance-P receptor-like n=1 Tax=Stylophora pistillata TaxID=50429 RepID=UPI000C046676|nr:substance-P receptor-like [Stylophora pistillata]
MNSSVVNGYFRVSSTVCMTLAYVVIFVLGFFGNICIIYIVVSRKRMRTNFNFLVVNMAVADLLVSLFLMPVVVKFLYTGSSWIPGAVGKVTCKFVNFLGSQSIAASIITLVFVTVDRYFAVLHPLRDICFIRSTKLVTSVIWISSSLYFMPYLLLFDVVKSADGSHWECRLVWNFFTSDISVQFSIAKAYYMAIFLILYLVPLVVIAWVHVLIGRHLWSHQIPGKPTAHQRHQNELSKRKVLRMIIIVTVTFALCWLPAHIQHLLIFCFNNTYIALLKVEHLTSGLFFISHANSAINPCLFIGLNQRFNDEFRGILRCLFCRNSFPTRRSFGTETPVVLTRIRKTVRQCSATDLEDTVEPLRQQIPVLQSRRWVLQEELDTRHQFSSSFNVSSVREQDES